MSFDASDELDYPRITPAVQWLMAINVAISFLQLTVVGAADMQTALGFSTQTVRQGGIWTLGTYMFVHADLWHLAVNMYSLYIFGPRLEHRMGSGKFTHYYLWCGLGGLLLHFLLAREGGVLIGASGAIFGVMLAYAMRYPDDLIYFFGVLPMKVKWMVVLLVVVNLMTGLMATAAPGGVDAGGNSVAYFAHVGGFLAGLLYLRTPSSQGLQRLKQRVEQIPDLPDETPRAVPRSLPRPREKEHEVDEIVARSKAVGTRRAPPPPAALKPAQRKSEELNLVLDKISEQGIDSLTREERRLLEEMSKQLRDR